MAMNSKIQWTHHTFNPWWLCTKVSPECDNCYAEALAARFGYGWGRGIPRRTFGDAHWDEPRKWNRKAEAEGVRRRVFCASMADVFDAEAPESERERLWQLIRETPALDWQLLTKRPNLIRRYLPPDWGNGYPNVWLGASVGTQKQVWRAEKLRQVPAVVHFLSCEPLLGSLDIRRQLPRANTVFIPEWGPPSVIDWVIVGGESGPNARQCHTDDVRDLVEQCREAGVAVFVKQLGSQPVASGKDQRHLINLTDPKGGDLSEWPEDLRIRQFPGSFAGETLL